MAHVRAHTTAEPVCIRRHLGLCGISLLTSNAELVCSFASALAVACTSAAPLAAAVASSHQVLMTRWARHMSDLPPCAAELYNTPATSRHATRQPTAASALWVSCCQSVTAAFTGLQSGFVLQLVVLLQRETAIPSRGCMPCREKELQHTE